MIDRIGKGGMGEVYRADDLKLGVRVALKFLPASRVHDADWLRRMHHEVRISREVSHPNVCRVFDITEAEGEHFISMECVEGDDLHNLLRRIGHIPRTKALEISRQICEGLAAAHDKGVLHRDLKPANIMLDNQGSVRIMDFGIAALVHKIISSEIRAGTPAYMAPEQLAGREVTPRSDIYSLGLLLFEIFSGEMVIDEQTLTAIQQWHDASGASPSVEALEGVDEDIAKVIHLCLRRDPAERPESARDVAAALPMPAFSPRARREPAAEHSTPEPAASIAVLPFDDLSPGKDQGYFCEGMAEEILSALCKIEKLRVASRTSSFKVKEVAADIREIGERLGVKTVLEGSVRKAGKRLRVTAQLINVEDGYHLWSERYDGDMEDIFAIQDEISQKIVEALQLKLTPTQHAALQHPAPEHVEAYDYYLRGRAEFHAFGQGHTGSAQKMFLKAIELDPSYALAHAGLADCYSMEAMWVNRSPENLQKADDYSRSALVLAPQLAEAHTSRGFAMQLNNRHREAEVHFEMAILLDPTLFEAHYLYARHCIAQGKDEKAIELFEKAARLQPEDSRSKLLVMTPYKKLGREVEAEAAGKEGIERAKRQLELNPRNLHVISLVAAGYAMLKQREEALVWADRLLELTPPDGLVIYYNLACMYASLGMNEKAIDCLELHGFQAIDADWIEHDGDLDPLREHPRFVTLMAKIKAHAAASDLSDTRS
ncbi:MAG: protein kinase [Planctomycetes bacterium]|nr:protein kinase [Planctomycetota bacterium]